MAITDKLKAIANAIRSKTGKTEMLTLDDMPSEIEAIEATGGGGDLIVESLLNKTITDYSNDGLLSIGNYAFTDAINLKSINTPNVEEIGTYAFSGCSSLTTMDFKKCKTVGERGFYACGRIQSLDMPLLESVGTHGFSRMLQLKTVNTPLLKTIGNYGFYVNSALLKVDFLQLESIDANAFASSKIETLIIRTPSVCTLVNTTAFSATPIAKGNGYIYVPKSLLENYKTATNWSTYASQFRAIEDYSDITGG